MPHDGQIDIVTAFFIDWMQGVFLRCGRKYGKTDVAIYCMYMFGLLFEGSECYYVADEKDHARDICWDNRRLPEFFTTIRQWKKETTNEFIKRKRKGIELQKKWVASYNNSEMIVKLHNGSILKVDGAKNFSKADGLSPIFVVYDEFKHHNPKYDQAMRPNLKTFNGRIMIIGTPPDNEDNYYCATEDEFKNKKNHKHFLLPSHLNPHVYDGPNDEGLKEEEEALRLKGEHHIFLREYMCEIVPDASRQIFPMFDVPRRNHKTKRYEGRTKHVRPHDELLLDIKSRKRDFDFHICFDAGSAVCFGVLLVAVNRHDKRFIIIDEIYEESQQRTSTGQIYPRAEEKMDEIELYRDNWYQIYDHAATWFQVEVANQFDEHLNPCQKDTKKKEAKLSIIKDIMLVGLHPSEDEGIPTPDPIFLVSDRCQNFISEVSKYAKDENGKIAKRNDHLLDCLRYILNESNYYTLFEEYKKQETTRRFETPATDFNSNLSQNERILSGVDYD